MIEQGLDHTGCTIKEMTDNFESRVEILKSKEDKQKDHKNQEKISKKNKNKNKKKGNVGKRILTWKQNQRNPPLTRKKREQVLLATQKMQPHNLQLQGPQGNNQAVQEKEKVHFL